MHGHTGDKSLCLDLLPQTNSMHHTGPKEDPMSMSIFGSLNGVNGKHTDPIEPLVEEFPEKFRAETPEKLQKSPDMLIERETKSPPQLMGSPERAMMSPEVPIKSPKLAEMSQEMGVKSPESAMTQSVHGYKVLDAPIEAFDKPVINPYRVLEAPIPAGGLPYRVLEAPDERTT